MAAELTGPALRFLTLAGDRALGLDTAAALAAFEQALALTPPDHLERAAALARFGDAAYQAAHHTDAADALEEAITLFRQAGDLPAAATAMLVLAAALVPLGDRRQRTLITEAVALLHTLPPSPELVAALTDQAGDDYVQGRDEAAIDTANRVLALADQLRLDPPARAIGYRGAARFSLGDRNGLEDIREAIDVASRAGQGHEVAMLQYTLAAAHQLSGELVAALAVSQAGLTLARLRGLDRAEDVLALGALASQANLGDFDDACEEADRRAARLEAHDDVWCLLQVRSFQIMILTIQGKAAQAEDWLNWLESTSRTPGDVEMTVLGLATTAVARAACGQHDRTLLLLHEIGETLGARDSEHFAGSVHDLVRAALTTGDRHLAKRLNSKPAPAPPLRCRGCRRSSAWSPGAPP